jgi:hypothetical protein
MVKLKSNTTDRHFLAHRTRRRPAKHLGWAGAFWSYERTARVRFLLRLLCSPGQGAGQRGRVPGARLRAVYGTLAHASVQALCMDRGQEEGGEPFRLLFLFCFANHLFREYTWTFSGPTWRAATLKSPLPGRCSCPCQTEI